MAIEKHVVSLEARDTLSPVLQKVGREADTAGRKAEDAGKRATRSTQDWGRAASALGTGLGLATAAAIKFANEAEVRQKRLEAAIQNTGHSFEEYADSIDKAADSALKLAFDDDDAIDSLSQLTDATGDANRAISDLAIAQDIARGRNISLAQATDIVIAAETGRIQSLKRMGIEIDASATKEEALGLLQQKYAGQAEAYAETNAATWDRVRNDIGNTLESIGGHLADFQGAILAVSTAGMALGPISDVFTALDGKAKVASVSSKALALALSPAGLAVGALGAAAGITYLIEQIGRYDDAAEQAARSTLDLSNFFKSLAASLDPANQRIIGDLGKNLDQIITDAAQRQSDLDKLITLQLGITNEGIDISTQAAAALAAETTGLTVEQLKWIDGNKDLKVSVDEVNSVVAMYQRNLDRLNADQVEKVQADIKSLFSKSNLDYEKAAAAVDALNQKFDAGLLSPEQYVAAIQDISTHYGDYIRLANDATVATIASTDAYKYASTEWKASVPVLASVNTELEASTGGLQSFAGGALAATDATRALDDQLDALGASLKDANPGETLDRTFGAIVGYTDKLTGSIDKVKQWSDAIMAPLDTDVQDNGSLSKLVELQNKGLLDAEDYTEALEAQTQVYGDLTRAQDASAAIQIKQADILADQTDATADYLESIAKLPEAEQTVALAWADSDIAGRAMDIADMAAGFNDMNQAQQQAFSDMVTSAAAADPMLASVLESVGLIKADVNDPTGWTLVIPADGAQATIQDVVDAINRLTDAILGIPDATVDVNANTEPFYTGVNSIPAKLGDRYIDVWQSLHPMFGGNLQDKALGGVSPWPDTAALGRVSSGNMTLVGENGPELINLPGGALVTPNHATRHMGGRGEPSITIQNMTVVANNPQQFMRQMRDYASTMSRS